MKVNSQRLKESIVIKQAILDEIKKAPMNFGEIKSKFNLSQTFTNSCIVSLRNLRLIRLESKENAENKTRLKYHAISDKSVLDMLSEAKAKMMEGAIKGRLRNSAEKANWKPKFSPYASMTHTVDDVNTWNKTKGQKNNKRLDPWTGYSSF